jgi:hypothetical protein
VPVSRTVGGSVEPEDVTVAAADLLRLLTPDPAAGGAPGDPAVGGGGAGGSAEGGPVGGSAAGVHGAGVHGAGVHGAGVHGAGVHGAGVHGAGVHGAGVHGAGVHGAGGAVVELPRLRDPEWRSALPPTSGWARLDEVPAEVVRSLVRAGAAALRAVPAGAAASAGESLLDHESLTVSGAGRSAPVPLRVLTAVARMGFLGDPADPPAADAVVVAAGPGGWVRLAAAYGSAYHRSTPTLALRPR